MPQIAQLARDPSFLLDCLRIDDPEIARSALRQLAKVTGKPIRLDLSAPAARRRQAIAALRAELIRRPATLPADSGMMTP